MKKLVLVIMVFYAFAKAYPASTFLQEYVSHQVKEGETVSSISNNYGITEKAILKLNPDAKTRIYEGLVLILPATASVNSAKKDEKPKSNFITHKVKRKETLYGIAKKYNVSEAAIKKHNKELYSKPLRKGALIFIPTFSTETKTESNTPEITTSSVVTIPQAKTKQYTVKAKETKYGIARKYGITIAQLDALNPSLSGTLQEGARIVVPDIQTDTAAVIDNDKYSFYEVQKGNTVYSLLKKYNITADQLVALNPAVADGLKEGMILQVPKGQSGAITVPNTNPITTVPVAIARGENVSSLADSLRDYSVKKIAVMLPLGLSRAAVDTTDARENLLKSDRLLRVALDFHSGVLMAVKDAEKLGISTTLSVYDTDYVRTDGKATNARKVENIIRSNDFSGTQAVIGPFIGSNIDRAVSLLASTNTAVISPLTLRVSGGSNMFQSQPSTDVLRQKMLDYLEVYAKGKNVVIIADSKNAPIKSKLQKLFPEAKLVTPRKGDNGMFLYGTDIPPQISDTEKNVVILETNDIPLISSVTTGLNALLHSNAVEDAEVVIDRDITLFTTLLGKAYDSDEIQNEHLMNLNFHFPSVDKEYDAKQAAAFVENYENQYNISPGTEAIRGYDITMDTLLRLGYAQDLFQASQSEIETQYVENKFSYSKSPNGGYYNTAAFIMKYDEDLKLKEVVEMIESEDGKENED